MIRKRKINHFSLGIKIYIMKELTIGLDYCCENEIVVEIEYLSVHSI